MADHQDVLANIERLEALMPSGLFSNEGDWNFKSIWDQIKRTGASFKGTRFPTADEHNSAWERFQAQIDRVKQAQEERHHRFDQRREESAHLSDRLIRSAENIIGEDSVLFDVIMTLATGGAYMLVKMTLEALLGEFDERKAELQSASDRMKALWSDFSTEKGRLLRDDKDAVYQALSSTQGRLNEAWAAYKQQRREALDRYHSERAAQRAESQVKHEAWKDRTRANIAKNEDWLDNLRQRLGKQEAHLAHLQDQYADAWSDSFRSRVSDWIDEAHSSISDLEDKISRVEGYIDEDTRKLNDAW